MTDTDIARGIGRSQAYVSQLHRIMTDLDPKVTDFWRACPLIIPVDAMYALSKSPRHEQWEEYRKLLKGKGEDAGRVHKRGRLQALAKHARDFGVTLGKLVRLKYVASISDDFEDMVENVIKIPGSRRRSTGVRWPRRWQGDTRRGRRCRLPTIVASPEVQIAGRNAGCIPRYCWVLSVRYKVERS
jgi:hypothetical protein